jgi:hypothetical protein
MDFTGLSVADRKPDSFWCRDVGTEGFTARLAVVVLEITSVSSVAHLTDEGMVTGFQSMGNKFLHCWPSGKIVEKTV